MNLAAHQEKWKNERRENRRPISKKLRAALLRSFRGQYGEKMVCVMGVQGNSCPRKGQQPFRSNPNRIAGRTTTLRRLLIDVEYSFFVNSNHHNDFLQNRKNFTNTIYLKTDL